jgi:hypothetical protein
MVPQSLAFLRSRPRARSRARAFVSPSCVGIERLEERTLLSSATLAILDGNFTGTFKGSVTINNNGTNTTTAVTPTPFQMGINDGSVVIITPRSNGSGTVGINRQIDAIVNVNYYGTPVPVEFSGNITNVNAIQTYATGTWNFIVRTDGVITASGNGNWSASAPPVISNFDGSYVGTYQGSLSVTSGSGKATTPIDPGTFTAVINDGAITTTFPSSSGLTGGSGTIDVNGRINGTTTFVEDGVTITITSGGPASRGMQGVSGSGKWSVKENLPGGIFVSGSGTWTLQSTLVFDGSYAGTAYGTVTVDDNGTSTNNAIPSNTAVDVTIASGAVTFSAPGIPATGSGTIDSSGNITGTVSLVYNSVTVTIIIGAFGDPTPTGNVLYGSWKVASTNLGGGVTISGSGGWSATPV